MDDTKGLSYFLLGLGIGAAAGILFAPKSGEETREVIKSKANEGKDYLVKQSGVIKEQVVKQTGVIKDQASEYVDKGKDVLSRQKEQLTAAVEAGKQAYRETVGGPYDRPAGTETNY